MPSSSSTSSPVLSSVDVMRFAEHARQAKSANEAYLAAYPELQRLLADLVRACCVEQPADVRAFLKDYVRKYRAEDEERGQVPPDEGITAPGYQRAGVESGASLTLDDDDEE